MNSQDWLHIIKTQNTRPKLEISFVAQKSKPTAITKKPEATSKTPAPTSVESTSFNAIDSSLDTPQDNQALGNIHSTTSDNTALLNASPTSLDSSVTNSETLKQNQTGKSHGDLSAKSPLLDLSKISLSPDANEKTTENIFSEELQNKIEVSKQAQKEYLKGVKRETSYPITEDADGTRYVNIKGVCWRMPKDSSKDNWAIVFDGCGLKDKSFHFELNISPSMLTNELLGPDSPFTLEK